MKIIDCEQGTPEWFRARLGIPTASQFDRLLTPKTLKLSSSSDAYLHELLAERYTGETVSPETTGWMTRGTELEDAAARWYEWERDVETTVVGFVTNDAGTAGASPDRLVGTDGGLEIKCLSAKHHLAALLEGDMPMKYRLQVQGSLLICERDWWDQLLFNPELPSKVVRAPRDETVIRPLASALAQFLDRLHEAQERLEAQGCRPGGGVESSEAFAEATGAGGPL